ncbi:MAG: polysaccharide deacetylase family protein [Chitinivibrionales bacterium]|nr:polysaccharide deacetylase family protein [Chitinivibrionales bacterium]
MHTTNIFGAIIIAVGISTALCFSQSTVTISGSQTIQSNQVTDFYGSSRDFHVEQATTPFIDKTAYFKNEHTITNFDETISDWTVVGGYGTIATNRMKFNGSKSLEVVTPPNNNFTIEVQKTLSPAEDLSSYDLLSFLCYVPDTTFITSMTLIFYTSQTTKNCSYYYYTFKPIDRRMAGFVRLVTHREDFYKVTGTPKWSNVTAVAVKIQGRDPGYQKCVCLQINAYKNYLDRGIVIFSFDDNVYTIHPNTSKTLKSFNLRGTFFIPSHYYYNGVYYDITTLHGIEYAPIQNMHGGDIATHGYLHENESVLSTDEFIDKLTKGYNALITNNFQAAFIHAYPGGKANSWGMEKLRNLYACARIGTAEGSSIGGATNRIYPPFLGNKWYLPSEPIQSNRTTLGQALAIIDNCISKKCISTLMFHRIMPSPGVYDFDDRDFTVLCAYVKKAIDAGLLENRTFSDLIGVVPSRSATPSVR